MTRNSWDVLILDSSFPIFAEEQEIPLDKLEFIVENAGSACLTPKVYGEILKRKPGYPYRDFFQMLAKNWYQILGEININYSLLNEIEDMRRQITRLVSYLGQNIAPAESEACSAVHHLARLGYRVAIVSDDEDVLLYFQLVRSLLGWKGSALSTYELLSLTDRAYLLDVIEKLFVHLGTPAAYDSLTETSMCTNEGSFQAAIFRASGKKQLACHPRLTSLEGLKDVT